MKLELRSVRIKNCGPIDDIKLDFFDAKGETLPVCVIGGANGSGKTTILEAITSVAQFMGDKKYAFPPKFKHGYYIQADWRIEGTDFSYYLGQKPDSVSDDGHYNETRVSKLSSYPYTLDNFGSAQEKDMIKLGYWYRSPTTTGSYEAIGSLLNQQSSKTPQLSSAGQEKIHWPPSLIFLPHNRSLEAVTGTEVRKEEDPYKFVYRFETVRQFPGSLTSYLIWLDYAEPERYAAIQQFLNELNFEGKTFRVDRKSLSVVVKTASGQEHPLHELSSGEQNLLIILIELHRKLTPGSIVLIDEIENSLHPAFQHRLAQGLLALQREIPYQLIVTTHAPTFVEIFGAENTRLLTAF